MKMKNVFQSFPKLNNEESIYILKIIIVVHIILDNQNYNF